MTCSCCAKGLCGTGRGRMRALSPDHGGRGEDTGSASIRDMC